MQTRTVCMRESQITVFPGGEATPKPMRVVTKARWGHDQNTVLTGSADGFLRVFDVRSGEKVRKVNGERGLTLRCKAVCRIWMAVDLYSDSQ